MLDRRLSVYRSVQYSRPEKPAAPYICERTMQLPCAPMTVVAEARHHDRVGARRLEGLRATDHFGKVGATPKILVGARRQHERKR